MNGDISMSNNVFVKSFYSSVSESDWLTVDALRQVLNLVELLIFCSFLTAPHCYILNWTVSFYI